MEACHPAKEYSAKKPIAHVRVVAFFPGVPNYWY